MKEHVAFVHEKTGGHSCPLCGKLYATRAEVRIHNKSAHEGVTYPCEICKKVFKSIAGRKSHVEINHEGKNPSHKCSFCEKCFFTNRELKKHVDTVHEKKRPYACDLCGMRFGQKPHLVTHLKGKHKQTL